MLYRPSKFRIRILLVKRVKEHSNGAPQFSYSTQQVFFSIKMGWEEGEQREGMEGVVSATLAGLGAGLWSARAIERRGVFAVLDRSVFQRG